MIVNQPSLLDDIIDGIVAWFNRKPAKRKYVKRDARAIRKKTKQPPKLKVIRGRKVEFR